LALLFRLDLASNDRLDPHPHVAAVDLLDVEGAGLVHEIAELADSVIVATSADDLAIGSANGGANNCFTRTGGMSS
jgi:hypothetical protein